MKRLFIVDDDEEILQSLEIWFDRKGFEVKCYVYPEPMLSTLKSISPDVILMDVNLHHADGRTVCKELKEQNKVNCPILLFSANPTMLTGYTNYLADGAIAKPFSLKELTTFITSFIKE